MYFIPTIPSYLDFLGAYDLGHISVLQSGSEGKIISHTLDSATFVVALWTDYVKDFS